jgi:hypothetical protein
MKIRYSPRVAGTAVYWDMTKENQSFIMRQLEQLPSGFKILLQQIEFKRSKPC